VRFIQVYYLDGKGNQPWDTHQDNDKRHRSLCANSDRATAALLTDLKRRGLLDDTLVIWGGEFGRTPYAQPTKVGSTKAVGRDHHHTGFTMLLAGGGVRGGLTYGATDELGMNAVVNRVHVHDLHATVLHLLGLDHETTDFPIQRPRLPPDRRVRPGGPGRDRLNGRERTGPLRTKRTVSTNLGDYPWATH
jgi:arylsulfatase A-like enzyme